jgi:hypothetical protein
MLFPTPKVTANRTAARGHAPATTIFSTSRAASTTSGAASHTLGGASDAIFPAPRGRRHAMSATQRCAAGSLVAVVVAGWLAGGGCSAAPASPGGRDAGVAIFPVSFRQSGFHMVRACRAPGEHSALNGFTVWVDDAAAATYDQILSGGGAAQPMPDGAIVVKELYGDRECTVVDRWVAMKKAAGFDPGRGDWYWQDLAADRAVVREGQLPACSDCHEGRDDGTCIGYGAVNGMDYLCTAP